MEGEFIFEVVGAEVGGGDEGRQGTLAVRPCQRDDLARLRINLLTSPTANR